MSEQVEVLERSTAIPKNIDPTGRQWVMKYVRGSSCVKAQPEPFRKGFICPELFKGLWTSKVKLQEQITLHLTRAWDASDLAALKATRKKDATVQDNKELGGADDRVNEPVSDKPVRAAKGKGSNKSTSRKVPSKGKES